MLRLPYHLLDVFTREPFGGNQLAVFTDAASIAPDLMPRIARELNLSETVFILPPDRGGLARLRIFTPGTELPFAGHPTIGTACLLAALRDPDVSGLGDAPHTIMLEEGAGDVHVLVRPGRGGLPAWSQLTATQRPEIRRAEVTRTLLSDLLGVDEADVGSDAAGAAAAEASCGVPFLFIAVRSAHALARCRLNIAVWESRIAAQWAPHVFVYTIANAADRGGAPGSGIRGRMFAPAMGIAEDPATGAAAAALAGLLAHRARSDGTHRWTLSQGVEMGRPSTLELEADVTGGEVTSCRVGGHAVVIGRGELLLPA